MARPRGKRIDGKRQYEINSKYLFVTWSRSTFGCNRISQFYAKLQEALSKGTKIYGCLKLHQDGTPDYHALIVLPKREHWRDARRKLQFEEDTNSIIIQKIQSRQTARDFVHKAQKHIEEPLFNGECKPAEYFFGERISDSSLLAGLKVTDQSAARAIFVTKEFYQARLTCSACQSLLSQPSTFVPPADTNSNIQNY